MNKIDCFKFSRIVYDSKTSNKLVRNILNTEAMRHAVTCLKIHAKCSILQHGLASAYI